MINNYTGKRRSLTAWLAQMRIFVALNNKQICNSSVRSNNVRRGLTGQFTIPQALTASAHANCYKTRHIFSDLHINWQNWSVKATCGSMMSAFRLSQHQTGAGFSTKGLKTQWEALQNVTKQQSDRRVALNQEKHNCFFSKSILRTRPDCYSCIQLQSRCRADANSAA